MHAASRNQQTSAMPWLRRAALDSAAAWNALARRQLGMMLDCADQQIERLQRMRLDELELRELQLERLDVVAVLDLVKAVGRGLVAIVVGGFSHATRIGAGISVDRQQRVHSSNHSHQRPVNATAGAKVREIFSNIGSGQPVDIDVIAEPGAVGVVARVQPLLPLANGHLPELEIMSLPE